MNKQTICTKTLVQVLSKMLAANIRHADYHTEVLQGGTIGNVLLITGKAETTGGEKISYNLNSRRDYNYTIHESRRTTLKPVDMGKNVKMN